MSGKIKISLLIMPQVNLLDLGCISQVFLAAQLGGLNCELEFCATETDIISSVQLPLGQTKLYSKSKLKKGDYLIVLSSFYKYILSDKFQPQPKLLNWLKDNYNKGVVVCSLCNASILLGKAGLLDNKKCTTNWLRTEALRKAAPKAKILENILFCEDNSIITGAGGTACFDLGLYIILKLRGGKMAHEISKRLMLYNIRKGNEQQISIFLKYREHTHQGIHKVQDYLADHINQVKTISDLADLANMSERNFTRIFKKETGKTVKEFITELRIEKANQYLAIPDYSRIQIANECGLQSERHLRRLIKKGKNANGTHVKQSINE
jgi:transcriptional regulator GlxA family with amidase domain